MCGMSIEILDCLKRDQNIYINRLFPMLVPYKNTQAKYHFSESRIFQ